MALPVGRISAARARRRSHIEPQIMIAPLIDVVFQLLIFFMLINRYVTPGIQVALPESSANSIDTSRSRTVTVTADGATYLDDAAMSLGEIETVLAQDSAEGRIDSVRLRADRQVPFEYVVRALEAVRNAGIGDIAIETAPLRNGASDNGNEYQRP
jgi:biopolymer transport protein ExbD